MNNEIVVIRGGGDLATGVVQKFHRAGFNVLILEVQTPTAIRRGAALCEAVYNENAKVEDIKCSRIFSLEETELCWENGVIPLYVDPDGKSIGEIKPSAVIDAIMAKRNSGTVKNMADVTIALGPGFTAGEDVHVVIETQRGNDLGRLIFEGQAKPDTGVPGEIAGESADRVIRAPEAGAIKHNKQIGDIVSKGEIIASINQIEIAAPISGLLRGLIHEGFNVHKRMKIADIDPRTDIDPKAVSDKARCLGGAALEAYFYIKELKI